MATIRHINEEEYAAKALELLNHRREGYVNYALSLLKQSMSLGQASEKLEDKVKEEMGTVLFEYLKHRGIVCGDVRYLYNINGYCRRIRRAPSKHEVSSNLLDIEQTLPNYEELIGNIMLNAEKIWVIAEIETITKEAKEKIMTKNYEIIDGRCVIPHGVSHIVYKEFESTYSLREVVIPTSVHMICAYAFSDCLSLTGIELPHSITAIGTGAFSDCPLKSVKLPKSLLVIGSGAFAGCELESVDIPENVLRIGEGAFSGCAWLEGISVDEKNPNFRSVSNTCLTKDGKTVVFGCKNSFIPSGVRHIGIQAFEDCWDLESITIPEGVVSIGDMAFSGCHNLKRIKLPKTLKTIGREAFSYCEKLIRPEIPAGVTCIGEDAFFLPKDWNRDELPF